MASKSKLTDEMVLSLLKTANPAAASRLDRDERTDLNLFDTGVLDSYSMVKLVQIIEDSFDIVFDYTDLQVRHFRTIATLKALLVEKYDC